jgi:hypothetical protein
MGGKVKRNKVNAYFSDEAYYAFKNGEAVSNNGFRSRKGAFFHDQPDFEEIDENELVGTIITFAVFMGIAVFVEKAFPRIKHWWDDTAAPGIKKAWFKFFGKEAVQPKDNAIEIGPYRITPGNFSKGIDVVLEEYRADMSSEEAQEHLIKIMILAGLLADEIRKLSGACIKENGEMPDNYLEWQNAMEKLTTQQVADSINLILASNNNMSLLDENTSRALSRILGNNLITDGRFVPIKNDRLKEALSLKSIGTSKEN